MTNEIYLDNAATTKVYPEVADTIRDSLLDHYYNPSAFYLPSIEVEKQLAEARKNIGQSLSSSNNELYFTSGATESNNTLIKGAVDRGRGDFNIITSSIEHPSVMNVYKDLENRGVDVRYIPVDEYGNLDYDWLDTNLDNKTLLVSVMGANNEIGTINDLVKLGQIIRDNSNALFHTDYTQAYFKSDAKELDLKKAKPDAVSVSAHKIHGPKGIGALALKKGSKVSPLLLGGGQEHKFRSGTENIPGILGFNTAVEILKKNAPEINEKNQKLKEYFLEEIQKIPDVVINSPQNSLPGLLSVSLLGIKAEVLLHMLEAHNIFISSGSACSTHEKDSYVHKALGYDQNRSNGTIRISLSEYINKEDLDRTLEVIENGTNQLRKLTGFKR